jgi:murein DD-endopeptidase MepM/ murein hydrolase activator NlpD
MSWYRRRGAPSMARRMSRRLGLLLAVAALPLALWGVLPLLSDAETPGSIQNKIESARGKIEKHRARERVLTSDISAANQKIGALQADITQLQSKQVRLQADLEAKRAELAQIQEDLRRERLKLARLRDRLARARVLLAERLVQSYKDDAPDVVTVVLEADGFSDLLERAEYMERVSDQDARLIDRVTVAKAETVATARRLDKLEARAQEVAKQIEGEVTQVVQVKGSLINRRDQFAAVRADKAEMLAGTRASRAELEEHVDALEKEQSAILAKLQGSSSPVSGPVKQGSGGLVWPVSGPVTSGFGYRWGRLHAGVDIAVPVGTAVHAAQSGRVAIAGWVGGYGNYVCIQHAGALSTCYGHNSSIGVSVGQSVTQGQVIAASGNTGNSTGPHVHFETRINGNPVDPMGYL